MRLPLAKFPEVTSPIDILTCKDPSLVADAVCEVVPWRRQQEHHGWLRAVCGRLRALLPSMALRDLVRVTLAFGELYTKRRTHTLLFYDYETYALLFQAMPLQAVTAKTLLPLLRTYRRMGISHESFVRAACERVVSGEVELQPPQLTELVQVLGELKIVAKGVFEHAVEVLDLKFPYFSEDQVGDFARAFCSLRYRSELFLALLRRELPFRLHEYAWWNLIDIAEMYLVLQVDDREIIQRIGNEAFKLIFSMKSQYPAKALKVLAFLETGDKRTFRMLIRSQGKCIRLLDPVLTADTIMACVAVSVEPEAVYHRLRGSSLYYGLIMHLLPNVGSLSAKKTCDVLAALVKPGMSVPVFMHSIEAVVKQRPFKFHAEHLVSLLRDFAALGHRSPVVRGLLAGRAAELAECTPSALCSLPAALAGHPAPSEGGGGSDARPDEEERMLAEAARLLCEPGVYRLPSDPRAFRSKDDFWWQQLRQRHFRLRKRAAGANTAVEPALGEAALAAAAGTAVAHLTREECLQLVSGCARLEWRHEALLAGTAAWLCEGRRHAELSPGEVAELLDAFSVLGFTQPLLRAALEHALLRVASQVPPADCVRALRGALDAGMNMRSAAVRALLHRLTGELAFVPTAEKDSLGELAASVLRRAEQEVLSVAAPPGVPLARLPLELQLFGAAVAVSCG